MSEYTLRVNRVHYPVTALGPGKRLGIWVQGCTLECPGCIAHDTWSAGNGVRVNVEDLVRVWREVLDDGVDGLTVSGGEPLQQADSVAALLRGARLAAPGRAVDLLLYTGYEEDELTASQKEAAQLADAVVVGRYKIKEPTELIWRGSANQRFVLNSALGDERYSPFTDHRPERTPLQFRMEGRHFWLIGIPRSGDLVRLERSLAANGIELRYASWRARGDADKR